MKAVQKRADTETDSQRGCDWLQNAYIIEASGKRRALGSTAQRS
jgi:hypothetical protein